jgi:AcrR family transcriptional regulator
MGRRAGSKNSDFEQARSALLTAVRNKLYSHDGLKTNFQELAKTAGVSTTTLRHYFGSRQGLIRAVLEQDFQDISASLLATATQGPLTLRDSLEEFSRVMRDELLRGGLRSHEIGLGDGLCDKEVGPAYIHNVFEPLVRAMEARFSRLITAKAMGECNTRNAALIFLTPLLLGLLHQHSLGGDTVRPLEFEPFLKEHLDRFIKSYQT